MTFFWFLVRCSGDELRAQCLDRQVLHWFVPSEGFGIEQVQNLSGRVEVSEGSQKRELPPIKVGNVWLPFIWTQPHTPDVPFLGGPAFGALV